MPKRNQTPNPSDRGPRLWRAIWLCLLAFGVCMAWSVHQWLILPHRHPLMLLWLVTAPFISAAVLFTILTTVRALLPHRPLSGLSTVVVPVLHVGLTLTIATMLVQRSSPFIDLNEPQTYVAVWQNWRLLLPIGGLEAVFVGLLTLIDHLWMPIPASKKKAG